MQAGALACTLAYALLAAGLVAPARAAPQFTAARVIVPAGSTSHGTGINAHGTLSGWYAPTGGNAGRAFYYLGGALTELDTLGGTTSFANGISDEGTVVGASDAPGNQRRAFRAGPGVGPSDLHVAGWLTSSAQAIAAVEDLDNGPTITGFFTGASGTQAWLLVGGGGRMAVPSLGGSSTVPRAINADQQIVGNSTNATGQTRPFLYSGGNIVDLGTFGGASGIALGINSRGDVVGHAESTTSPARAFLYTAGQMHPLGTLGGNTSSALGINDANQIVGESANTAGAGRAFLYMDGALTDLNTLVVSGLDGAVLTSAIAINTAGQIVAQSCSSALACATYKLNPLTPGRAHAVEYYHAGFDHYFATIAPDEIAKLDDGTFAGWVRTGEGYDVDASSQAGTSPVCRFFSASFAPKSSHFYTAYASECATVTNNPDWQSEGVVFHAAQPDVASGQCPAGRRAVYRLYNNGMSGAPNHRYTASAAVRASMVAKGWLPEGPGGVGFCA